MSSTVLAMMRRDVQADPHAPCCLPSVACCAPSYDVLLESDMPLSFCRQGSMLLLAGSMDGSAAVLDADTGTLLWRHKAHAKYCVRVRWSPDDRHFVSCSWDHTLALFSHTSGSAGPEFKLVKTEMYASQVQDVEFVPGSEASQQLLTVASKNTNYLCLFDMALLKVNTQYSSKLLLDIVSRSLQRPSEHCSCGATMHTH